MAGFDDSLVREYFEMNGFFVRQSRKYAVQSRRKRADEEGDLLVINPSPRRGGETPFQLFSSDLPGLSAAVVAVKAWHSTKAITPTMGCALPLCVAARVCMAAGWCAAHGTAVNIRQPSHCARGIRRVQASGAANPSTA